MCCLLLSLCTQIRALDRVAKILKKDAKFDSAFSVRPFRRMALKNEYAKDNESSVGLLQPAAPMTTSAHSYTLASRYRYALLALSLLLTLAAYHALFRSTQSRYIISPSELKIDDDNFILGSTLALPKHVGSNRGLTYAQCDIGFPLLWPQLMETANKDRGRGVSLEDLESSKEYGGTRVAIIENQLYVKSFNPQWTKRTEAVLASLHEAVRYCLRCSRHSFS